MVNQALPTRDIAVGDRLDLTATAVRRSRGPDDRRHRRVGHDRETCPVAAARSAASGSPPTTQRQWLVDGGPVSWATVRELNAIGATVASRAVIERPAAGAPSGPGGPAGQQPTTPASRSLGLIVVMALIEVVLLAGPAFAVGARKQQRSLALMAATGGTPKQSRRVIVGRRRRARQRGRRRSAWCSASGSAWLLVPLLQSRSDNWFGPFEVPWLHLAGVAGFGMLSAFLAARGPGLPGVPAGRRRGAGRPPG